MSKQKTVPKKTLQKQLKEVVKEIIVADNIDIEILNKEYNYTSEGEDMELIIKHCT